MYVFGVQSRYYFIWLINDSINNATGLGFNGYDSKGDAKWDLVTNIFPWEIEFAVTLREMINLWNFTACLWLRRCGFRLSFSHLMYCAHTHTHTGLYSRELHFLPPSLHLLYQLCGTVSTLAITSALLCSY